MTEEQIKKKIYELQDELRNLKRKSTRRFIFALSLEELRALDRQSEKKGLNKGEYILYLIKQDETTQE